MTSSAEWEPIDTKCIVCSFMGYVSPSSTYVCSPDIYIEDGIILLMEEIRITTWHVWNPVNNRPGYVLWIFTISTGESRIYQGYHPEKNHRFTPNPRIRPGAPYGSPCHRSAPLWASDASAVASRYRRGSRWSWMALSRNETVVITHNHFFFLNRCQVSSFKDTPDRPACWNLAILLIILILGGGFNPFEKLCSSNWIISPGFGVNIPKICETAA